MNFVNAAMVFGWFPNIMVISARCSVVLSFISSFLTIGFKEISKDELKNAAMGFGWFPNISEQFLNLQQNHE